MSLFAKIMVVVNLILAVVFLAAAGTLHGAAYSWKSKKTEVEAAKNAQIATVEAQRDAKEKENVGIRDQQRATEQRAVAAEAVQKTLNEGNANLAAENARLKAENEKFQANLTELAKSVQDQTGRNKELSDQLSTSEAERKAALEQVATLTQNLAGETARADDAEKNVAAGEVARVKLADDLGRTSTELAAYKIKYPPLGAAAMMKSVNGVVAQASAKDDVYVLSVGSKDGVEIGYEFTVFRGNEYVSTIVVDTVYPNYSAGRTKAGTKKSDVKAGDSAATKI